MDTTDVAGGNAGSFGSTDTGNGMDPGYAEALDNLNTDPSWGATLIGGLISAMTGGSYGKWGAEHGYATGMPGNPTGIGGSGGGDNGFQQLLQMLTGQSSTPSGPLPGPAPTMENEGSRPAAGSSSGYTDPMSMIFGANSPFSHPAGPTTTMEQGPVTNYARSRMRDPNAPPPGFLNSIASIVRSRPGGANGGLGADETNSLLSSRLGNVTDYLNKMQSHGDIGDYNAVDQVLQPMLAQGRQTISDIGGAAKRLGYDPQDYVPNSVIDATDLRSNIGGLQGSVNPEVRYANSIARRRSGVR